MASREKRLSTVTVTIPTPACAKLALVADDSQKIGVFLDWLEERGIVLAHYDEDDLERVFTRKEDLLAEYFDVDLKAVERERRAILAGIRASHDAATPASNRSKGA